MTFIQVVDGKAFRVMVEAEFINVALRALNLNRSILETKTVDYLFDLMNNRKNSKVKFEMSELKSVIVKRKYNLH